MVKYSDMPGQPTVWDEIEIIDSTGEIGMKFQDFKRIYGSGEKKK